MGYEDSVTGRDLRRAIQMHMGYATNEMPPWEVTQSLFNGDKGVDPAVIERQARREEAARHEVVSLVESALAETLFKHNR